MIHPGKNGFIVKQRTPEMFFEAIEKALKLRNVKDTSMAISEQYSTKNIASDLESLWQPLSKK